MGILNRLRAAFKKNEPRQSIQVDMFDVQLGASLLLQFRLSNGQIVRVLADAGVDEKSKYPKDHVHSKLFNADGTLTNVWSNFSGNNSGDSPRIDLIVGTHYDADHLRGLVPIIDNTKLRIDEIWLPPIQDDGDAVTRSSVAAGTSNLVTRLMADDGDEVLAHYLASRHARIQEVDSIYDRGLKDRTPDDVPALINELLQRQAVRRNEPNRHEGRPTLEYFTEQRNNAERALGREGISHAHDNDEDHDQRFLEIVRRLKLPLTGWFRSDVDMLGVADHDYVATWDVAFRWAANKTALTTDHLALETIRKSAADEAITASNLAEVVMAIKRRHSSGGSHIRIRSEAIAQGTPRYFRWTGSVFEEANPQSKAELGFHLMGPSHELVEQLHEKLPIGTYLLAFRAEKLTSGTVTPSNRLSYVMRFHLGNQNILIVGDTGFSDFAPPRSQDYHPKLLSLLAPLHVIQVAHHGGINHRFYEALSAAGLPEQTDWSFLLLSHAHHDSTRPRAEFCRFASLFRNDGRNDVSVLFTNQPTPDKVKAIADLIHPPVPSAASDGRSDIRISFPHVADSARGGTQWRVERHGIEI